MVRTDNGRVCDGVAHYGESFGLFGLLHGCPFGGGCDGEVVDEAAVDLVEEARREWTESYHRPMPVPLGELHVVAQGSSATGRQSYTGWTDWVVACDGDRHYRAVYGRGVFTHRQIDRVERCPGGCTHLRPAGRTTRELVAEVRSYDPATMRTVYGIASEPGPTATPAPAGAGQ